MSRPLARLALSLSLLVGFAGTAAAGFAAPPPGDARAAAPVVDAPIAPPHAAPTYPRPAVDLTPRLDEATRARLRTALVRQRARNVRAFHAYVRRGVFPHNFVSTTRLNVWRDPAGHLCAAATMIDRSGAHALVRQVARDDNFVRLADVTSGPLLDWILTSGLTHAEVVAIQEPFMGGEDEQPRAQWMPAEDARLRARYAEVKAQLAAAPAASVEAAIDALAARPDLIAQLLRAR
ncbi:MAG: hypothetical protein R3B06_25185 [Kofleriaceae bacterium]